MYIMANYQHFLKCCCLPSHRSTLVVKRFIWDLFDKMKYSSPLNPKKPVFLILAKFKRTCSIKLPLCLSENTTVRIAPENGVLCGGIAIKAVPKLKRINIFLLPLGSRTYPKSNFSLTLLRTTMYENLMFDIVVG